ncbi:MAG TPA: hypothetical protein VLL48_00910 [Longimicrobiales bacterium]|nr:hypothetical protein [Longimicrobiales bacterium]
MLPRILVLALIASAVLATSTAVGAQNIPSPYRFIERSQELGPVAGYISPDRGQFDLGPGPGPVLGGRYAIRVGGPFSIEGIASAVSTDRRVIDPDQPEGSRVIGRSDVLLASVEARLRFSLVGDRTWNRLAPHFSAGGGFVFDLEDEQAADRNLLVDDRFEFGTSFLGSMGVGTMWIPWDRLLFRLDGELRFWQLEIPTGFRTVDRFPDAPEDEWVSGFSVSAGLAYLF